MEHSADVVLFATPWPYYTMPSIQIATLKAYLVKHGISTLAVHAHLEVAAWLGFANYKEITSEFLEDGESLYGYLLFPELRPRILASNHLKKKKLAVEVDGQTIPVPSIEFFIAFERMHERILQRLDWTNVRLVGFTLNFGQTLSSLYLANRIKQAHPHIQVIMGGAEASGALGESLLAHFPWIDFICNGEGEKPLLKVAQYLKRAGDSQQTVTIPQIPGILSQRRALPLENLQPIGFDQLPDLLPLECPDFTEYFESIKNLDMDYGICTCLPLETSRGCFYSCSFCALNLQWENFREVPHEVITSNIAKLSEKHGVLEFFFVDNITPRKVEELCLKIKGLGLDLDLFYETRANLPRASFEALKLAGVTRVQLGIEAFSTSLLQKFNKKSSALHNLQGLKNCAELDIKCVGNIISYYPFASQEEIQESLCNLELAMSYPPSIEFSTYALEVGSPDYKKAGEKGLEITGNFELYERAYPKGLLKTLNLPRKAFHFNGAVEESLWTKVENLVMRWRENYALIKARFGAEALPLTYKDGRTFLLVEDLRNGRRDLYQFPQMYRDVYLAAKQITPISNISQAHGSYTNQEIQDCIEEFLNLRFMARENNRVLSLAIKDRRRER